MRLVIQRVSSAAVAVEGKTVSSIGKGLLVLLGVREGDTEQDARRLAEKCARLRIFPDAGGKMNLSVVEAGGDALVVSQFTLYGDVRKGNRPSFASAAEPKSAERLITVFVEALRSEGVEVGEGIFGAQMEVSLTNDGPVTIIVE